MPTEGALRLPALPVLAPVEAPPQLPPVLRLRPLPATAAAVDRDQRRPDPVVVAALLVVVFGVVGGVAEYPVPPRVASRLVDDLGERGGLVGRPDADLGAGEEVALGVAGNREQDVPPHAEPLALAAGVVAGGVAAVQARAIDGRRGLLPDQAAQAGAAEGLALELAEPPFWRSRRSA